MSHRIKGKLGDAMLDEALKAFFPDSRGDGFMAWEGSASSLGLTTYRSEWRSRMREALEAAFQELLKEPTAHPDHHGGG